LKKTEHILKSKSGILESQRVNVTFQLLRSYDELNSSKKDDALLELLPVRLVASNESFFKETFAAIINHSEKVLERASSMLKRNNIKITIEDVKHIQSKKFTIGDLISYSFSYSSIDTILKTFEDLTNIKVYEKLDNMAEFIKEMELDENLINENRPFDKNRILSNLNRVYEIRHVICHDFLSTSHHLAIDKDHIRHSIMDAGLIQHIIIDLCSKYVYTDIELDSEKQIINLEKKVISRIEELNTLNETIKSTFHSPYQLKNFEKGIKSFNEFVEIDSKNFGFWFNEEGPFKELRLEHKINLFENRIELIKEELKNST
jgi:hypothetical protein